MELARKGKAKRRHLDAEQCSALGTGPDATSVLLGQPQSAPRPPNRGLHPRTPTKRKKHESPSKQHQKSINEFYRVTGVVSSSPQKLSQPSASTHTAGLNGETNPAPLAEPRVEQKKGEDHWDNDDDDDDDDDISLLAALADEHPEMEEGAKVEEEEEEEIDYLEGITSEMFDDCLFECPSRGNAAAAARDSTNQGRREMELEEEEEGVEPLPDAHYGLLGSSNRGLQEPQGRMEDLPEEVLRQILLLLPAQDLYRCTVLVCHLWRNIVQDPKFVPYKKQYYRYMMGEKDTVAKIKSILEDGGVLDQSLPQESVRRLVSLMAQHAPGERLLPEDLMRCIKGHRLFPLAQSSLALRFPDLQQHDPNPYAAMAIILVLSEAVTDVQELVGRLFNCMSRAATVEYLSHIATYLLAMMKNEVKISSRLHYNIFYVLYLMHNSSNSVSAGHNSESRYQVTHEQQQILSHDIQPDHLVKIMAFAGTGKTSTLVRFAEENPHLRFLYVAFNKSVANEALRRFPSNVACKTVHSIAYNDVGKCYQLHKKLTFNLKVFSIAKVLSVGRGGYIHGKVVTTTLNAYMASADRHIAAHHVPNSYKNNQGKTKHLDYDGKMEYVRDCEEIWRKMKDLNEKKKEGYYMTHDGYLKLWQLKEPKPCLSYQYDVIFIDEAQDCTPAIMDVLLAQSCAKVLVGDPHQQIYTFRGAVNALRTAPHTHLFYLTQSFRFGPEIAYVGATLLQVCKKVQKILVGGNQKGSVYGENFDPVALVPLTGPGPGSTAILSRCNFGVFNEAVRLTDVNPSCRIYFVGGVNGVGLSKILDIWLLKQPRESRTTIIQDAFIRSFGGYNNLQTYALQSEDRELEAKLAVVEKHAQRVPELVGRLRACHQEDHRHADFILGTVHKAKGLEFDTVMVCDDFARIPCARHHLTELSGCSWWDIPQDEWNLLYVAVTRAKNTLILTKNIRNIVTHAGEYFLKSEVTGSLLTDGLPPRCSIPQCLHHISADAAFTMCKRPMKYMDGFTPGGPLCERCVEKRVGPIAFLMSDQAPSAPAVPERQDLPINMLLLLF
ncbi:F-box DNA helicase 1 [Merluccius polli]|uniref:F-box DNA helicase 1 n=1 Tax=Merluccius polli TaxID=89951 RepID=A0AA47MI28_MERPO|nr:F-box DNA helicase 1 [Merluccius polli]